MGKFALVLGFSIATLGIASICFAGQVSHSYGVRSRPSLPFNSGTHVPYVGNQRWGSGTYGYGGQTRSGLNGGRRYRYPGILTFPFYPVSDWGGYLGDSNPYYDEPAPAVSPDAYAPDQYVGPQQQPGPYYPPPQAPYPAPYPAAQGQQQAQPDTPPAEPLAPIVLILHSGQKLQLSNYAVVNDVVWDFSKPAARKIAVSSIDLAASAKATEEGGGDFPDFNAPATVQNP